ncbi:MAG: HlyD family efflux transporter periplasmic adaptor subunit, partial [Rhodobacteraceae bacterium]|nr:HlyD family efflux transporter periplasmic adaptor subunit [Paracoccaceae bacterium]
TRALLGVFLLSATLGLMTFAAGMVYGALQDRWAQESTSRPARERVFAVNVVAIEPSEITPELTTFGEIRSLRTLEIRATATGDVIFLSESFENGGVVKAGELLVQLDPTDAQASLDVAGADMRDAQADLRDAERSLDIARDDVDAAIAQAEIRARALARQRDLLDRGVGTEASVETAELAAAAADQQVLSRRQSLAQAEARIDQAATTLERREIALREAQLDLDRTEIRASFDGVVSDVNIVEGGLVATNERLASLIDPERLEVAFRISTPQYARLLSRGGAVVGLPVSATFELLGLDLAASGTVVRESGSVSEGQTGRELFARLDAAPGFRPGDFVTVRMTEPALRGVARIPAAAVDAAETVLVIGEEERLEVASVQIVSRQGDDVLVRARELAGREVVAERTPLLGVGIRVRPLRPAGEGPAPAAEPELVTLEPERRAKLIAAIEGNSRMPADVKARMLDQLSQDQVPARIVARIEERMGG